MQLRSTAREPQELVPKQPAVLPVSLISGMGDAAARAKSQGLVVDAESHPPFRRHHFAHHGDAILIDLPVSEQSCLLFLSGVN